MAKALAVHMKPNRYPPILALMLSSATLLMTFRKITNMTVAMMDAAVTKRALRNVKMAIGRASQREYMLKGMAKMRTQDKQAEVRNRPNMTWEAILMRSRISLMFAGRLTKEIGD